jgi:hypothetical protein
LRVFTKNKSASHNNGTAKVSEGAFNGDRLAVEGDDSVGLEEIVVDADGDSACRRLDIDMETSVRELEGREVPVALGWPPLGALGACWPPAPGELQTIDPAVRSIDVKPNSTSFPFSRRPPILWVAAASLKTWHSPVPNKMKARLTLSGMFRIVPLMGTISPVRGTSPTPLDSVTSSRKRMRAESRKVDQLDCKEEWEAEYSLVWAAA